MAIRRWARTVSVVLAVALWLGLGLAVPIVMSLYSSDVTTDAVEAAPGDAFALTVPIVLADAPSVRIERGTVAFVDGNGKALPAASSGAEGPQGNLRLYNALIMVGPDAGAGASPAFGPAQPAFPVSPFVDALTSGRYETLSLRRATIVLSGLLGAPETLTEVKAEVSLRRRGQVTIKGTSLLRGRVVSFDASIGGGTGDPRSAAVHRAPVRLALKGEHVEASFDGRMVVSSDEIELQGQGELAMPSVRALARWFGSYWPSGAGLRDASVRGQVRLGREMLTFENAVTRLDGNEANGVLGLRLRQPRPVLTGTLAFRSFDAKPYLRTTAERESVGTLTWASLAGGALSVPLGMHLDADLRISADRVVIGALDVGRFAATIALEDGRLLADVANLKFNGGEGGGQITADFTGFTPKVTLRGKLDEVDLSLLSGTLAGGPMLQGRAGVVADLAGAGSTLNDVLWGMAGKIAIRGQSPGRVGVDLRGLAAASRNGELTGWGAATRGSTGYDGLDLRLVLRDGTILTETVDIRTPEGAWSATGVVNLLSDRMDLRLSQTGAAAPGAGGATAPGAALEVHGPLREPRVRSSAGP